MTRTYEINSSNPIKDLNIKVLSSECISVEYKLSTQIIEAKNLDEDKKSSYAKFKHELLIIDKQKDSVCIKPIITSPAHPNFFKQKYDKIESITLEGFGFFIPNAVDEVLELLEDIPLGFVKDYEYAEYVNIDEACSLK